MRFIKYLFAILIGLSLCILSLANRQMVSLKLLPDELAGVFGVSGSLNLPLFLVILFGVMLGLMIGFVWEYLREYKHRRELSRAKKEMRGLEREVGKLKEKTGEGKDEILALIE